MRQTTVISLLGGPGVGKSTTAAELFALMKRQGMSVELVREYVKNWAWEKRDISKYDQLYITAKQFRQETLLYGKVDYIITDSPVILGPFYEKHFTGEARLLPLVKDMMDVARADGVSYHNFILERLKPYVEEGRYQTEEQAKALDGEIRTFLEQDVKAPYTHVNTKASAATIMRMIVKGEL